MTTEKFLNFWHGHINGIIGILFISVFVLVAIYVFLEFLKERKGGSAAAAGVTDVKKIEDSLRKLLENAQTNPVKASGESTQALESLKVLLAEKEELIKKLQSATASTAPAADGAGAEEIKKMNEKIVDLEGRLAEYSIIEDDIADLSMFKEENAKLKEELERVRSGSASTSKSQPVAAVAPPQPAPAAVEEEVLSDDIMAEFAAAVQEQKSTGAKPIEKAEVSEVLTPPEVMAAEKPDATEDLGLSSLDAEKMLSEIESLNSTVSGDDGSSGLEQEIDTDKMLSEADQLNQEVKG